MKNLTKDILNAKITFQKRIHESLMILRVCFLQNKLPPFKPGQFGTLGILESYIKDNQEKLRLVRRSYSVASGKNEKNHLEYFITKVQNGILTDQLFALKEGDLIWMSQKVTGFFTLEPIPQKTHLIWIATGTGVAPFVSMLRSNILQERQNYKMILLHGVRYKEDLAYEKELEHISEIKENFFYSPIVSRPDEIWKEQKKTIGRVQSLWQNQVMKGSFGFIPSPQNTHVMLCGNPYMIEDMLMILDKFGFSIHTRRQPGNIHFEKYWTKKNDL